MGTYKHLKVEYDPHHLREPELLSFDEDDVEEYVTEKYIRRFLEEREKQKGYEHYDEEWHLLNIIRFVLNDVGDGWRTFEHAGKFPYWLKKKQDPEQYEADEKAFLEKIEEESGEEEE